MLSWFIEQSSRRILQQSHNLKLALCCYLAEGHLLIEDRPGVGKTLFAKTIAEVLGLKFARVQGTSDLLPSDVIGGSVWHPTQQEFLFHPGPIFSQVLLLDELNRMSPRSQSAFLQGMEEGTVSVDGVTHALPKPFFVIATQNTQGGTGTHPLPESQWDRFLMRISLGNPGIEAERTLLLSTGRSPSVLEKSQDVLPTLSLTKRKVILSPALAEYILALVHYVRTFEPQLSTRAVVSLGKAACAMALIEQRDYVIPEDVTAIFNPVLAHRFYSHLHDPAQVLTEALSRVSVP